MSPQDVSPCPTAPACIGVLLTNLGTPDSPKTADVRRYLKQFLSDPRVVEFPKLPWWLFLNGVILHTRPRRSARLYRKIWTEQGSPLLVISREQQEALQAVLDRTIEHPVRVELAMRYGNPSIAEGLERLRTANARTITVLPLYPQYSATTTASTFDAIGQVFSQWRWIPGLHFISDYHDHPGYIRVMADSVRRFQRDHGEAERLLFSFHGIPRKYAKQGDPYPQQCRTTAQRLAEELELPEQRWATSFQSRMGRSEWLRPYTDETLTRWAKEGVRQVQVVCPGFPTDCLETLEEIGQENRDCFLSAGGEGYQYIPALNTHSTHIAMLAELIRCRCESPGSGTDR
jgi:ferrochelatase